MKKQVINPERVLASRRGFTLIELLIVMFIFSAVMVLAASSLTTGFISGRLSSTSSKDINRDVNSIYETIQLKMATAIKGDVGGETVYGFKKISDSFVVIKTLDKCDFIGVKSADKALYIKEEDVCSTLYASPDTFTDRLSSTNLEITSFDLSKSNEYSSTSAPYLTIGIKAKDAKTDAQAEFENTFTLDSLVVKGW